VSFEEKAAAGGAAQPRPRGVLVPSGALRRDGNEDVVYVLKDRRAQRRGVTLGPQSGDSRQVLSGVSPGESVIVDAPAGIRDEAAVTEIKQ
jgi:hypothetical protein